MRLFIFCIFFGFFSSVSATSRIPTSMSELVKESSEIAVAKIVTFVGYTESGELITNGDLRTGCCSSNSIGMKVRVIRTLFGSELKVGSELEIRLSNIDILDLSGMQEFFSGTETIVFLVKTPKGLLPVADHLVSKSNLPTIKKLISGRSSKHN